MIIHNKWSIIWILVLCGGILGTGVPPVQAGPHIPRCIRRCQNGVIYYFFSTRRNAKDAVSRRSGRIRAIRPRPRQTRLSRPELERLIKEACQRNKLPPALIKAVIRVESNFNPAATSSKGAMGLMQLMPATAEQLQVRKPYDSRENILAGCRYLRMLLEKFGYRLPLALAAYNAGPERVRQYRQVPPFKETQAYVRNVCVNFLKYDVQGPTKP